jgi:hypothetical protein
MKRQLALIIVSKFWYYVCLSVYFTYMGAGSEVLGDAHEPTFDFDVIYFLVFDSL